MLKYILPILSILTLLAILFYVSKPKPNPIRTEQKKEISLIKEEIKTQTVKTEAKVKIAKELKPLNEVVSVGQIISLPLLQELQTREIALTDALNSLTALNSLQASAIIKQDLYILTLENDLTFKDKLIKIYKYVSAGLIVVILILVV